MARVRKTQPTLDTLFFITPEQRVIRFLLSEPTTSFSPRVIASRLKGVRGLGGADGLSRILTELEELELVEFVNNRREVRLRNDSPCTLMLKRFVSFCELEGLKKLLTPLSTQGILHGCRAAGDTLSDSAYDLFVVSEVPEEVRKVALRYPLARQIELTTSTPDEYRRLDRLNPDLSRKVSRGIVIWGEIW